MKSLETVQKWAKAFKIICTIFLVLCIVAAVLLGAAAVLGDKASGTLASIGELSINGLFDADGPEAENVRLAAVCGLVELGFAIVLLGIAVKYLKDELESGTPFTYSFAKRINTLAILTLVLPIAADIICSVIDSAAGTGGEIGFKIDITLALVLFAAAAVFKYGADITDAGKELE